MLGFRHWMQSAYFGALPKTHSERSTRKIMLKCRSTMAYSKTRKARNTDVGMMEIDEPNCLAYRYEVLAPMISDLPG